MEKGIEIYRGYEIDETVIKRIKEIVLESTYSSEVYKEYYE